MAYTLHTELPSKRISYGGSRKPSDIKYIVLHYTGNRTDSARNNANYYSANGSNTREAGAHYFVDETTVYNTIDDLKIAYSVGGGKRNNQGGSMYGKITNVNSISIEMCSTNGVITLATIDNALNLCIDLMMKYGIDPSHVYRHYDVNGKLCPGWNGWVENDQSAWIAVKKELQKRWDNLMAFFTAISNQNNGQQPPQPQPQPKADILYQAITVNGRGDTEVVNRNSSAGWANIGMGKIACRATIGTIHYQVHIKGRGWLPYVTGYNWWDGNNGFAGTNAGNVAIDGFRAYGENLGGTLKYQASVVGNPNYYPVVTENNDYAGVLGKPIDNIKIWVE